MSLRFAGYAALFGVRDGGGDTIRPGAFARTLGERADPLPLYLASLERMRALPPDTLVLPSHGRPFRGLHQRLDQLRAHHASHLDTVLAACQRAPHSAADILPLLFTRALDAHQSTFAMGEALAHLHLLWHAGQLQRHTDSDGVLRFAPAA